MLQQYGQCSSMPPPPGIESDNADIKHFLTFFLLKSEKERSLWRIETSDNLESTEFTQPGYIFCGLRMRTALNYFNKAAINPNIMSNEPRPKKVKVLLFQCVTFHIYQLLTKRQYLQLEDKVCPEADYWFVLFKVCILRLIFQVFQNKGFFFLIFFFYFLSNQ